MEEVVFNGSIIITALELWLKKPEKLRKSQKGTLESVVKVSRVRPPIRYPFPDFGFNFGPEMNRGQVANPDSPRVARSTDSSTTELL
jgi:hypothetical protein